MYLSGAISRKLLVIVRIVRPYYALAQKHMKATMFMLTKVAAIAIATTLGIALGVSLAVPALAGPAQSNSAMESHTTPLQSGDLVRLRSGGPLMIVKNVQGDQVICSWSEEDGKLQSDSFPIAMLTAPATIPREGPESTRKANGN